MQNYQLLAKLDQLLASASFIDYCPNGLQVEGTATITKIITGVSLSQELIDIAIKESAQAIIVHHGLLWNKQALNITGIHKQRLAKLLKHEINLFAYHLPLDNHSTLGNNIQLAQRLSITVTGHSNDQNLLWHGKLTKPMQLKRFLAVINQQLGHNVNYSATSSMLTKVINNVAWCTGGAANFFQAAIKAGADVYITGDNSEPAMALAHESGVAYIAAGHYVTERYGIIALTKYLSQKLKLKAQYVELYNPA